MAYVTEKHYFNTPNTSRNTIKKCLTTTLTKKRMMKLNTPGKRMQNPEKTSRTDCKNQ